MVAAVGFGGNKVVAVVGELEGGKVLVGIHYQPKDYLVGYSSCKVIHTLLVNPMPRCASGITTSPTCYNRRKGVPKHGKKSFEKTG